MEKKQKNEKSEEEPQLLNQNQKPYNPRFPYSTYPYNQKVSDLKGELKSK